MLITLRKYLETFFLVSYGVSLLALDLLEDYIQSLPLFQKNAPALV